jgi:MraZ protein
LILGESTRTVDDRFRLSLPAELAKEVAGSGNECLLAKEQPGCLSLWSASIWQTRIDEEIQLVRGKIQAGRLSGRLEEVQLLGRLLSTRHTMVHLAGRGRLLIPEGFREFLGVEPGGTTIVIGAAVCVEIWHPRYWQDHIAQQLPDFRKLIDQLVG